MDEIELEVARPPAVADVQALLAGLVAYNRVHVEDRPEWAWEGLGVFARHSGSGRLVAGADGHTGWSWLFVSHLWVTQDLRGGGVGRLVMGELEEAARARGCTGAWLDTFSFQARGFYERIGYRQFGELTGFPPGHTRHFMAKRL